jgi:hypothetical protein
MAKLFVFAIGGTGSRVLRSLTMLLASGAKLPGDFDTIVPIIIDPDSANGDLNRTTDILTKYQSIRKSMRDGEGFFSAKIETLTSLSEDNVNASSDHFFFELAGTQKTLFEDFIGYHGLSDSSKGFMDLLFTQGDLKSNMDVGFKGKPNIGSVVLNQIIQSRGYEQFLSKFDKGDSVFIISSIFGGTGAAGFPLLLKNLRTEKPELPGSVKTKQAIIGAISYLPYFKITPPEDKTKHTIDSATFFQKAKAALSYYEHAIVNNESLNSFYYIADQSQNDYEHHDGKAGQLNKAHFLEFAGALAILDFLNEVPVLQTNNGKAVQLRCKEFGVEAAPSQRNLRFSHLGPNSLGGVRMGLSKMALMDKFIRIALKENLDARTTWTNERDGFNQQSFFAQDFYTRYLSGFLREYHDWLSEMEKNDISFSPFHGQQGHDDLLNFINGIEVKNNMLWRKADGKRLTEELNKKFSEIQTAGMNREESFVRMFDAATERVVSRLLN